MAASVTVNSITFGLMILVIFAVALFLLLFVFLWRRKRFEDQRAFDDILQEPTVKTCYTPGEFSRSVDRKDDLR